MREIIITPETAPGFVHLIPELYMRDIQAQELVGKGLADEEDGRAAAVLLCRETRGWMEIVWIAVDEDYRGMGLAGWLLHICLQGARQAGELWGAFADLTTEKDRDMMRHILIRNGFAVTEKFRPVYTVPLQAIAGSKLFDKQIEANRVRPLKEADNALRKSIGLLMKEDRRPLPMHLPINWEQYDDTISGICMIQGKPAGVILVSRMEEELELSFLWANHRSAAALLLVYAMKRALDVCPPQTQVSLAAVSDKALNLAEAILPDAQKMRIEQGRLNFIKADEMGGMENAW